MKITKIELSEDLVGEVQLFEKLKKVIESCLTLEQLEGGYNLIQSAEKNRIGVANALRYVFYSKLSELKQQEQELERETNFRNTTKL